MTSCILFFKDRKTMNNEAVKVYPKEIKVIKPKKILIKKGKERKVFESLDISLPQELLLKKDNKNNNSSDNIN